MSTTPLQPPPPQPVATPAPKLLVARIPVWGWVLIALAAIVLFFLVSPVIMLASLTVLITAIVSLAKKTPTWLGLRTQRSAQIALAVSAVLLLASSAAASAMGAGSKPTPTQEPRAFAAAVPSSAPLPSPTPSPTPVTKTVTVTEKEVVPFERTTIDDPNTAQGTQTVTTVGVNGERTKTYEVVYVDGVETSRTLVSDTVTTPPVSEVTSNGTYVAPVTIAAPPPPAPSACHPNYTDGCVPNDPVDVDCAGGDGDGPSYLEGTARVVGKDVYKLDRDGNGIACG